MLCLDVECRRTVLADGRRAADNKDGLSREPGDTAFFPRSGETDTDGFGLWVMVVQTGHNSSKSERDCGRFIGRNIVRNLQHCIGQREGLKFGGASSVSHLCGDFSSDDSVVLEGGSRVVKPPLKEAVMERVLVRLHRVHADHLTRVLTLCLLSRSS